MENETTWLVLGNWLEAARLLVTLVAIAWGVAILNFSVFNGALLNFGLQPRQLPWLIGIGFYPFLHSGWSHLEGNTIPFLVFGGLIILRDPTDFAAVTLSIWLLSGISLWVLGNARAIYVGASDLVFGYLGFLMSLAFFDRNLSTVMILLFTSFFYGKLLWGLLPLEQRTSWEGHLFGFISGIVVARYLPGLKAGFVVLMEFLRRLMELVVSG